MDISQTTVRFKETRNFIKILIHKLKKFWYSCFSNLFQFILKVLFTCEYSQNLFRCCLNIVIDVLCLPHYSR